VVGGEKDPWEKRNQNMEWKSREYHGLPGKGSRSMRLVGKEGIPQKRTSRDGEHDEKRERMELDNGL